MGQLYIGISGWRYAGWRGDFYPKGLPQRSELEFAAGRVDSIELNGSFYSLQRPESYAAWYEQTPAEFVFSVKGSRFITHMRRLLGIETALANFFASGVLRLEEKLGPILWQFPERMSFDSRFEAFLSLLPRDTGEAAALARRHDERLAGRSHTRIKRRRPMRHALEVRSPTFCSPSFVALLRQYNVALVVADTAGRWPYLEDVTADFVYVRLHGDAKLYESGYSLRALRRWAERIDLWRRGGEPVDAVHASESPAPAASSRDVYVYFDNDAKVRAPYDAMTLMELLNPSKRAVGAR